MNTTHCNTNIDFTRRKARYMNRKLEMLIILRDTIERRLAGLNASIDKLKEQIKAYNTNTED